MSTFARPSVSTVIPGLSYRDAHAAIDWLVRALGFDKRAIFEGTDGSVEHAELTFGNGMVMLGSVHNKGVMGPLIAQPDEIGMRETKSTYLVVSDAQAIYDSAISHGAVIVMDIAEMPYGGKAFTCRDPEGHLWSIGEYDPWAETPS